MPERITKMSEKNSAFIPGCAVNVMILFQTTNHTTLIGEKNETLCCDPSV